MGSAWNSSSRSHSLSFLLFFLFFPWKKFYVKKYPPHSSRLDRKYYTNLCTVQVLLYVHCWLLNCWLLQCCLVQSFCSTVLCRKQTNSHGCTRRILGVWVRYTLEWNWSKGHYGTTGNHCENLLPIQLVGEINHFTVQWFCYRPWCTSTWAELSCAVHTNGRFASSLVIVMSMMSWRRWHCGTPPGRICALHSRSYQDEICVWQLDFDCSFILQSNPKLIRFCFIFLEMFVSCEVLCCLDSALYFFL